MSTALPKLAGFTAGPAARVMPRYASSDELFGEAAAAHGLAGSEVPPRFEPPVSGPLEYRMVPEQVEGLWRGSLKRPNRLKSRENR